MTERTKMMLLRALLAACIVGPLVLVLTMPLWRSDYALKLCAARIGDTPEEVQRTCGVPTQQTTTILSGQEYPEWSYFSTTGRNPRAFVTFVFVDDRVAVIFRQGFSVRETPPR